MNNEIELSTTMNNALGIQVTNYAKCYEILENVHAQTEPEELAKSLVPNEKECIGLDVAFNTASPLHCNEVYHAGLNIGYGLDKLATMSIYKNDVKKKLKELNYASLQEWADKNPDLVWAPYEDIIELD